ncbi:MAG: glycosyl hydrolase [bacterium]
MPRKIFFVAAVITLASANAIAGAQSLPPDSLLARALVFRSIGPAVMSGRISDLAITDSKPGRGHIGNVIYAGTATGGVWKSTNAGVTWAPVFDSVRTGSVGAVAVAPSNPDIVWVGTGEANNMRSSSWGTGVYKSVDGGRTWSSAMLPKSQHIGKIVIDPRDPSVVYVAALGPLWASGGERGLYKTTDGGTTWTNTKQISKYTGFTEIAMDPSNPDVLYAASLERERREYGFLPGGAESAVYKTIDGGKTWTQLKQGLPAGEMGRVGLSVCKSRPSTVYAMVHAKPPGNGLFRSDDAGATWRQVNEQNGTAWYYSQVRCDPTDPDHVVTLSANSRESHDGGKTFLPFAAGNGIHTDHHALWFNDDDPQQMLLGSDGGLYASYDGGRTWDHNESIVAGQFYTVAVDDAQPFYNVYGGLQDNQTWGGPSRTRNAFGPTNADWFRMAGGDGFYAVPDPRDPNFVYAESQTGGVVRYDARTGQGKSIKPVPKPGERQRYNWSAPILPSSHDAKTVYMAANVLFRSPDRGDTWETISPDLTRGIDRNKLPLRDAQPDSTALGRNEGTAEFSNISTIDESPLKAGLLVVGTDDGLIQVTRDGGKTWLKTDRFPNVPETTYVSRVVWSRAGEGTIYATLDGHRSNDFKPYVVKSADYGKTWTSITGNLPDGGSVQVLREHPRQPALLFVGTEFGVYFTTDAGSHWAQLKSGIPGVPVHDLQIQARANDLVVGTHGRGIYILDDLTALEHLAKAKEATVAFLFPTQDALLFQPNTSKNSGMGTRGFTGQNPDPGPHIAYLLNAVPQDARVSLSVVDASGIVVRELPAIKQPGLHRVSWDMRVGPPLTGPVDTLALQGRGAGGRGAGRGGAGAPPADSAGRGGGRGGPPDPTFPALPGKYIARLTVAPKAGAPTVLEQSFALTKDPMVILSQVELKQLYAFRFDVVKAQRTLREKQAQLDTAQRLFAAAKRASDSAGTKLTPELKTQLAAVEKELADITREMGAAGGGRGGAGGGGGAAGAGRGGRGGTSVSGGRGGPIAQAGAPNTGVGTAGAATGGSDEEQNPAAATTPQNIQAKLGTTTEMLTVTSNPNPEQKKTLQAIPAELQKAGDRVKKMSSDQLPALLKALNDAGINVRSGTP